MASISVFIGAPCRRIPMIHHFQVRMVLPTFEFVILFAGIWIVTSCWFMIIYCCSYRYPPQGNSNMALINCPPMLVTHSRRTSSLLVFKVKSIALYKGYLSFEGYIMVLGCWFFFFFLKFKIGLESYFTLNWFTYFQNFPFFWMNWLVLYRCTVSFKNIIMLYWICTPSYKSAIH